MLELIAGGCTHTVLAIDVVTIVARPSRTRSTPLATPAGAGGPYKLSVAGGKLSACKDKSNAASTSACLGAAACSSALSFASDRVILK